MTEDRPKRSLLSIVNPKRRSISRELTVLLIITIVVASAIAMSITYFNASRWAEAQLENKASEYTVSLTDILEFPLWNLDKESIEDIGRSYAQNEFVQGLRIIGSWDIVYFQMEKEGEVPLVRKTSDISHEGKPVGNVELSLTSGYYEEINRQLLLSSGLTTIVTLVSLIIMTGFLLRRFLRRPLKDLGEIVNSYASGKYDSSGHRMSFIEFQPFVTVLSEMGDKIKSQMTELRKHQEHLEELVEERTEHLEKKSQELSELNVSLQEANRHKTEFLANMSHELRTPLNSIIGYTKLILDGMEGEINEEQCKDLEIVHSSSRHLLQLINDLLDISKLEAGRVELQWQEFSVSDLRDEAVSPVQRLAEEKGLTLVYDVGAGIDKLYADKVRVRQVLLNILGNAVKFTNEGSVNLVVSESDTDFIFSVTDTGMGIGKEDLETIFDSFHRVDLAKSAEYEGTGLGLTISRHFVEMHGGSMWAESELGKGSTFSFTLPKKDAARRV